MAFPTFDFSKRAQAYSLLSPACHAEHVILTTPECFLSVRLFQCLGHHFYVGRFYDCFLYFQYRGNVLKIHSVKKEDRGTYYCVADNGIGKPAQRNVAVEVEFPPTVEVKIYSSNNWITVSRNHFLATQIRLIFTDWTHFFFAKLDCKLATGASM